MTVSVLELDHSPMADVRKTGWLL